MSRDFCPPRLQTPCAEDAAARGAGPLPRRQRPCAHSACGSVSRRNALKCGVSSARRGSLHSPSLQTRTVYLLVVFQGLSELRIW